MKATRTYPNPIWIVPQFLAGLSLIWIGLAMFSDGFGYSLAVLRIHSNEGLINTTEDLISAIGFGTCMISGGMYILWGLSIRWCNVALNDNGFTFVRPLRARRKTIPWNDIRGFSTSQMCQYRDISGTDALWCSDSIVIYESGGEVIEVIDIHNFRFSIVEKTLRKQKVTYLGFEPHEESFFGIRRYKHLNNKK